VASAAEIIGKVFGKRIIFSKFQVGVSLDAFALAELLRAILDVSSGNPR